MNLVAKEMLVCNPNASLVLSSGAGTEVQLGNAGFYTEEKRMYHRVDNIHDTEVSLFLFLHFSYLRNLPMSFSPLLVKPRRRERQMEEN